MKMILKKKILIVIGVLAFAAILIAIAGGFHGQEKEFHGQEKQYPVKGVIVDLVPERHSLIIAHEEIPGYMAAMTMSYPVKEGEQYEQLKPGSTITAILVVDENGLRLQDIKIVHGTKPGEKKVE
jgi:Cu/Ag efflux protein CusF